MHPHKHQKWPKALIASGLLGLMGTLLSAAKAPALPNTPAYLQAHDRKELAQFHHPVVLAQSLPPAYRLKKLVLRPDPKQPSYQIDYRCFCAGLNYSISILGSTQPFDLTVAQSIQKVSAGALGELTLGHYPALPAKGLKKPFAMTHWFGTGPLRHTVITGLSGNPAPISDVRLFLNSLDYYHGA